VESARRIAARNPGARLDPPLLLALDEIGGMGPNSRIPVAAQGSGALRDLRDDP
jgi:hypothetical protein